MTISRGPPNSGDTDGYRWPAEWSRHRGTLMAWPHNEQTWPGIIAAIPDIFERLVRNIAQFETVWLLAGTTSGLQQAERRFSDCEQVVVVDLPTNDVWTRDYGPTVVLSGQGESVAVDWVYNGWGERYPPYDLDAAVTARFAANLNMAVRQAPIVAEGGALEGDGDGLVLSTRSCLMNPNRNPRISEQRVTDVLKEFTGGVRVVWLDGGGFLGDDTDGHVDQLARFTSHGRIVHACCASDDPNAHTLKRVENQLRRELPQLELTGLPIPMVTHETRRLPASYCNFYIVNDGVLVPTFDVEEDAYALAVLREQFPNHDVVPFGCRELVRGLGAIHCLTQQLY